MGEEYLEDLVKRSLVLVTRRKSNGKIKSCNLHDLIRDLCIGKAREEKFFLHVGDRYVEENINNQRRLIFPRSSMDRLSYFYAPGICSALFFHQYCERLSGYFERFELLRVLDAVEVAFEVFPYQVLKLIHLRYLALTYTCQSEIKLPASILRLQNLQTLIIFPTAMIDGRRVCIPFEMWRMPQIRHLVLFMIHCFPNPCDGSSVLKDLQTLSTVKNMKCTDTVVRMIPNLRKLGINYDGDGINWGVYQLDNLVHLKQLENLKIHVQVPRLESRRYWGNLAFPETLKKLNLSGCSFRAAHMKIIGSLLNLEVLKLKNCFFEESKWETNEGEFAHLKFLQICFTDLQHWVTEREHFPILQRLRLGDCFRLQEIPSVIGDIPTLELIEVNSYDTRLVKSAQQIKEEQESYGNDFLQVHLVKFSYFAYYY